MFLVASILLDEKTPTAEAFSPIKDSDLSKPKTVPPPRETDFVNPENDLYSERCSELLDNLESVVEETENDFNSEESTDTTNSKTIATNISSNINIINKNINLKLAPLDLREDHIELPKNQQNLTTPGKRCVI